MEPKPQQVTADNQSQSRAPNHAGTVHHGRQHRVPADQPAAATPQAPMQAQAKPVPAPADSRDLILPSDVISKTHIARTLREIQRIDDFFHQAAIRGSNNQQLPDISKELESLMNANSLNVLQPQDRDTMKSFLSRLKSKAPVVHMSFPSEAGTAFLGKLLEWYRKEAHPYTVLHVGLQPELAAGCTVRTTNKVHDFSFRKRFEKSKEKLIKQIEAASQQVAAEAKAEQATAAPQQPEVATAPVDVVDQTQKQEVSGE